MLSREQKVIIEIRNKEKNELQKRLTNPINEKSNKIDCPREFCDRERERNYERVECNEPGNQVQSWQQQSEANDSNERKVISRPSALNFDTRLDMLSQMINKILKEEFPMLKNNSFLYNLVMYTLSEKIKTVQKIENVLSCIKENHVKAVEDVKFENGEILIKCLV